MVTAWVLRIQVTSARAQALILSYISTIFSFAAVSSFSPYRNKSISDLEINGGKSLDIRRVSFVVEIFAESSGCGALRSTFHHFPRKRLQACKHCSSSNKDIIPSISALRRRDVYQFNVPRAPSVKVSQFLLNPASPSWTKLSVPVALLSSLDNAQM